MRTSVAADRARRKSRSATSTFSRKSVKLWLSSLAALASAG